MLDFCGLQMARNFCIEGFTLIVNDNHSMYGPCGLMSHYLLQVGTCETDQQEAEQPSSAAPKPHDGPLKEALKASSGDACPSLKSRGMLIWLELTAVLVTG